MKATVPIFIITAMLTACTTSGGHGVDLSAILEPVAERREIEIYGASDFRVGKMQKAREFGILPTCKTRNSMNNCSD